MDKQQARETGQGAENREDGFKPETQGGLAKCRAKPLIRFGLHAGEAPASKMVCQHEQSATCSSSAVTPGDFRALASDGQFVSGGASPSLKRFVNVHPGFRRRNFRFGKRRAVLGWPFIARLARHFVAPELELTLCRRWKAALASFTRACLSGHRLGRLEKAAFSW